MEHGQSGFEPGCREHRDDNGTCGNADCGSAERLATRECSDADADGDSAYADADGGSADPTGDSGRARGDANYRVTNANTNANATSRDYGGFGA